MIISTTLLGKGTAPVVREAIRSAIMFVDKCLVIDTGADEEDIEEAREAASSKLILRRWTWCDDFAEARNMALQMAAEEGATWALTLDSDERLQLDSHPLRAELASTDREVLQAPHINSRYVKPRLIRTECAGRWRGPNHEGLFDVSSDVTESAQFWEARRPPGHLDRKWQRNLQTLIPYSAERPNEQRWHYYIAEAHRHLGEDGDALERYRTCVLCRGWGEEAAWAAYRGAQLLCEMKRYGEAIDLCLRGLRRHPGFAELALQAGIACARLGQHEHAIYWSKMASANGADAIGLVRAVDKRVGFRERGALTIAPYELEQIALEALGLAD